VPSRGERYGQPPWRLPGSSWLREAHRRCAGLHVEALMTRTEGTSASLQDQHFGAIVGGAMRLCRSYLTAALSGAMMAQFVGNCLMAMDEPLVIRRTQQRSHENGEFVSDV
jgi:hypothetical protein